MSEDGYKPDGPVAARIRTMGYVPIGDILMVLAREIDKINQRLDEHADPDLVGPHYQGDDS